MITVITTIDDEKDKDIKIPMPKFFIFIVRYIGIAVYIDVLYLYLDNSKTPPIKVVSNVDIANIGIKSDIIRF